MELLSLREAASPDEADYESKSLLSIAVASRGSCGENSRNTQVIDDQRVDGADHCLRGGNST